MTTSNGGYRRQYWDTCVFINFLTNLETEKADTVAELLAEAQRSKPGHGITIVISTLVIAEIRSKSDNVAEREVLLQELFETDWQFLEIHAVTATVARLAQDIGNAHPDLTVPDSVHLATAVNAKADRMFTYDGQSGKSERRRSGSLLKYNGKVGDPPLTIQTPWVYSGAMDAELKRLDEERALGQTPES